jgi:hypothetical protein
MGGRARLRGVPSDDLSKLDGVTSDSVSNDDSDSGREGNISGSGSDAETGRLDIGGVWCIGEGVRTWRDSDDDGKDGIGDRDDSVGGRGTSCGDKSESEG